MIDLFALAVGMSKEQRAALDLEELRYFKDRLRALQLPKTSNAAVNAEIAERHRAYLDWLDSKAK